MDFSDEMAEEILKIFQVESEEIISKLNSSLMDLEKKPNNKDAILMLFRDAHTLKGASRMVGFNNVQTIAHKMEDILGLAKENKILLNSKVVNVLYKTVDFLSDLIQKSIEQGHEVYSNDVSEHLAILNNVEENVDSVNPQDEKVEVDVELLSQNIKNINELLAESLFLLMKIESEKSENSIRDFLSTTTKLYEIFQQTGPYEVKKWLEDIKVKLEFICKGSNSLNSNETGDIHQTLDNIINNLIPLCELYNFELVDYYSLAFEKMSNSPAEKENNIKNATETTPTLAQVPTQPKEPEPALEALAEAEVTVCGIYDLDCILDKIGALAQNETSPAEIKGFLLNFERDCQNDDVKKILGRIIKILEFSEENAVQIDEDTANVLKQSIEHCDNIIKNRLEDTDNELIVQRLGIIQQILEFNQTPNEDSSFVAKSGYKIKNKKITDFSKVFNTGAIKTLRVESTKLDSLVNQVSELAISKIKNKKHVHELDLINKELEEWQRNSIKALNYLKYYDKKFIQAENTDSQVPIFVKQLLNLFIDNNKKVQETASNVSSLYKTIQDDNMKMDLIVDNLEQMVKDVRVLPLATVFHLFGRMVRDIAQEKGKEIDLEILGSETSTDKKIIEEIKTPLIHIIRNSIDHGIETPEQRLALGKNPKGKIILSAKQVGNKVIIQITDDGKGINVEKIKEKAIQKGFLTQEEINSMSDEQITNLIFSAGFSTGDEITNISGRGIGLDVVQSKIAQLNGKVKVLSEVNKGCCVQIELPTTMSTIKAFLVTSANQTFAIPMDAINTVLRKREDEIISNHDKKSIIFKEKTIPMYDLSCILNLRETCTVKSKETILVLENDDKIIALCVDKLIGDQEILHKKLSAPLYKLKNISGITTLASGEVCLILNIADILKMTTGTKKLLINDAPKKADNSIYRILLVDDSITTRTLEKNILTKAGYNVEIAQNPIEAFEKMDNEAQGQFDLIITDVEMPEMDGYEFLEKIKSNEMYSDIPVIMLSSLMTEENKRRATQLGAEKYIVKNDFNQDVFQETVYKVLHKGN